MTPREMIYDLWELSGQRTDLEPFGTVPTGYTPDDIVDCPGTQYWLRQMSIAERVITSYNKFGFKPLRFKDLIKDSFVKLSPLDLPNFDRTLGEAPVVTGIDADYYNGNVLHFDGTYTVSGTVNTFNLNVFTVANFGLDDAQELVDESVDIGGETYTIESVVDNGVLYTITLDSDIDSVTGGATISVQFTFTEQDVFILSTTDDGAISTFVLKDELDGFLPSIFDCEIRQNTLELNSLSLPDTFRMILKVVNIDIAGKIAKGSRKESFYLTAGTSQGRPSYWEQRGGRIYFDTSLDDETNLKFEVLTVPELITLDGEFFVSEPFETAIIAYVNWRSAERSQEFDKAYALKRNFESLMKMLASDAASEYLRDDNYGLRVLQEAEEI